MKTLTVAFALIASLNLFAQEPQKQNTAQNTRPDGLTLKNSTVWLYENGQAKAITEKIWTRNGMQVTPAGTLIFANGEKAQLHEGDFVSFKGAVARPVQITANTEVVLTKR